jgi:hypothetical protein
MAHLLKSMLTIANPDGSVFSNPLGAVPSAGIRAIKTGTTELCMANLGITDLRGFEGFECLHTLWVNNNALREVTGLDHNFRLRVLCAHNNSLSTLKGSIENLMYLEELNLAYNNLSHLDKCLEVLSELLFLKVLRLMHNPVAQEADYRLRVIAAIPCLSLLDDHIVTDAERIAARHRGARGRTGVRGVEHIRSASNLLKANGTAAVSLGASRSRSHIWLANDVARIQDRKLRSEADGLEHAFERHVDASWAAATRPSGDCSALPSALSVTVDSLNYKGLAETVVAQSFHQRMRGYQIDRQLASNTLRFAVLPSHCDESSAGSKESDPFVAKVSSDTSFWDRYHVRDCFRSIAGDGVAILSRSQLKQALGMVADFGFAAVVPVAALEIAAATGKDALSAYTDLIVDMTVSPEATKANWVDFLSAIENGSFAKTAASGDSTGAAENKQSLGRLPVAAVKGSSKSPGKPEEVFLKSPRPSAAIVKVPQLMWQALTPAEAAARAARHEQTAADAFQRMQRMLPGDPERSTVTKLMMNASEKAIYLQHTAATAAGVFDPKDKQKPFPKPRADVYSFTSLKPLVAESSPVTSWPTFGKGLEARPRHDTDALRSRTLRSDVWNKNRAVIESRAPKNVSTTVLRL